MTDEQKKNIYESYLGEFYDEWGDHYKPMTFEEFCEDCEKHSWEMI